MPDELYEEVLVLLKRGLVEKRGKKGRSRKPWFTKELAYVYENSSIEQRTCGFIARVETREGKEGYLEKKRVFKRAVRKARKSYENWSVVKEMAY